MNPNEILKNTFETPDLDSKKQIFIDSLGNEKDTKILKLAEKLGFVITVENIHDAKDFVAKKITDAKDDDDLEDIQRKLAHIDEI
jgi:hypothetical protein